MVFKRTCTSTRTKGKKYSVSRGSATIVMLEEEGSNQGKTTARLIRWTNLHAQKVTMNSSKTDPGNTWQQCMPFMSWKERPGEREREREREREEKLIFHSKEGDR